MALCRWTACALLVAGLVAAAYDAGAVTLGDAVIATDTSWDKDTYAADSLTVIDGATLRIAGGSRVDVAGAITVHGGATILLRGRDGETPVGGAWRGTGVTITAADVRVEANGIISADGQGYAAGAGPGAGGADGGLHGGAGGGHGGIGGAAGDGLNPGGLAYGDALAPAALGSGGGDGRTAGASGGGAIVLDVSGTLTLDGLITADGAAAVNGNCFSAPAGGGGAGGAIAITTGTLAGTGRISAQGGAGGDGGCFPTVTDNGGGGAGGRIAVRYALDGGFGGFTSSSAAGGPGGGPAGAPGTMVFIDTTADALRIAQYFAIAPGAALRVGAALVENGATLAIGGGTTLTVDGELRLTGAATILAESDDVAGPIDGEWRGVGVTIAAGALRVETGSAISADQQGYLPGVGPGAGGADGVHGGAGGGHGGIGGRAGDGINPGGAAYGDAFAPAAPGSGGGPTRTAAGRGGGAVTIVVDGELRLDGTISAAGGAAENGNCFSAPAGGGGAGGSINVVTATLTGTGALHADGGAGGDGGCFPTVMDNGGGGAGGRIAVRYASDGGFAGFTQSSVSGGLGGGYAGAPGSLIFLDTSTNALRIPQHLELPPDSSARFGALRLDADATLVLGGGATLQVDGALELAPAARVLVQGKNLDMPIDGTWQGAGAAIHAHTVRVDAGASISADGQGYAGGAGPGAGGSDGGTHAAAGAGHGGLGGRAGDPYNPPGASYDDAFAPGAPGSGGGLAQTPAGRGGGAIAITVTDTLTLDGTITADGGAATSGGCSARVAGGGAGGAIAIETGTLTGAGLVRADGGAGGSGGCSGPGDDGGGGAGGRVVVRYATEADFQGFLVSSVSGGSGGGGPAPPGTLAFVDTSTNAWRVAQHFELPPAAAVNVGALTVEDAATLIVGGGTTLTVARDLVLTGTSTLLAYSRDADAEVNGGWNGAGITVRVGTARIDAGSAITADAQGYLGGLGPGSGGADGRSPGGGGGYGGMGGAGGDGVNAGGPAYGDAAAPLALGSGGGIASSRAGVGGGALLLGVGETLRLDGEISANGAAADGTPCSLGASGGGAGGSILVLAPTITGAGAMHADGGGGGFGGCTGIGDDGGGGGGGRIAVYYGVAEAFAGLTDSTVAGGAGGQPGAAGTLRFVSCGGDCNGDGQVTIAELIRLVNVALELTDVLSCLAGDTNFDGQIAINEIVLAVNHALLGCAPTPPPPAELPGV